MPAGQADASRAIAQPRATAKRSCGLTIPMSALPLKAAAAVVRRRVHYGPFPDSCTAANDIFIRCPCRHGRERTVNFPAVGDGVDPAHIVGLWYRPSPTSEGGDEQTQTQTS